MTVGILSTNVVLDDDFVVSLSTSDLTGINNAAIGKIRIHFGENDIDFTLIDDILVAGSDYQTLTTALTFNSEVKLIDVNVTILDDDIVEFPEVFLSALAIVTMGPAAPDAILNPGTARITIEDEEDSKFSS